MQRACAGTLPAAFQSLSNLHDLWLDNNTFEGTAHTLQLVLASDCVDDSG